MDRILAVVTTVFEVVAFVGFAVAAAVEVARFTVAGGIAAGAVVLIVESAAISWRAGRGGVE